MNNVPGMTANTDQDPAGERQLRDTMVQKLIKVGAASDPRVVAAFRAVPRHLATPEVESAKTYRVETATITKTDENGVDISSVSAPEFRPCRSSRPTSSPG